MKCKKILASAASLATLGAIAVAVAGPASAATCTPTGYIRDTVDLTAAQIGGDVTGTLDATGCNIGVYYDSTHQGNVSGANIFGANYYGVVVNADVGAVAVNVRRSAVHNIGDTPLDGMQRGNAIYYRAFGTGKATGTISGNTVTRYQKNGITTNGAVTAVISNNTVTGEGPVDYIAQNGIQVGYGAKAAVYGNTVSRNAYTGTGLATSTGIVVVGGYGDPYTVGVIIAKNSLANNDIGVQLDNSEAVNSTPPVYTYNTVWGNTISSAAVTNTTGSSPACGYQAGVADAGYKDLIINNSISGRGYTPVTGDCGGTAKAFLRFIDADPSALIFNIHQRLEK